MTVGDDLDLSKDAPCTVVALQSGHQAFIKEAVVPLCRSFAFQTADTYVERLPCRGIDIGLGVALLANKTWFLMSE